MTELQRLSPHELRALVRESRRRPVPLLDGDDVARLGPGFTAPVPADEVVRTIIEDVRERGDAALLDWTERLDGVRLESTRVPEETLRQAWDTTEPELRRALEVTVRRLRDFHEEQRDVAIRGDDRVHLRPLPLRRAGCYVPGGRAAYPSTVLMNVIPAQVAGVGSIAITSPPTRDGSVHPLVGASAHLLGITEVHAVGGAQAVAALAYGTPGIERVDKITGPGNLFVTLAKRLVFGDVGIDGVAGPSEILVIASGDANPRHVAADLVSQLEHDPLAWALCVTDSAELAAVLCAEFAKQSESASRAGIIAQAAGRHGAVVVCEALEEAYALAQEFASEHLSLQGRAAEALRDRPHTAGAVFCGTLSPVSMGDYIAGPNHTLPTGGAARYRGPLSVMDFVRWPSLVQLSAAQFAELAPVACVLAEAEGLAGHERALRLRLEEGA